MMSTNPMQAINPESYVVAPVTFRHVAQGKQPTTLADIYQEETNIAIWQRELSAIIQDSVKDLLITNPTLQMEMTITPKDALSRVGEFIDTAGSTELSEDIAELVDMFCCLFELKRVGMRLKALDQAMCPKFHVDRVPCRLVTTYQGIATEWLPHEVIDHTKLGRGSNGQPDSQSGLYQNQSDIRQLSYGDVALLKGVLWQGNENAGLVHRSPGLPSGENRLLLTLDFIN